MNLRFLLCGIILRLVFWLQPKNVTLVQPSIWHDYGVWQKLIDQAAKERRKQDIKNVKELLRVPLVLGLLMPLTAFSGTWVRSGGGTAGDEGRCVAADSSGNVFIAGYITAAATFGSITLTNAGLEDIFVAKYSPAGSVIWAKRFGGTDNDYAEGLAVDTAGNVIICGTIGTSNALGNATATGYGMFGAKLDGNSGAILWSKQIGNGDERGHAAAVDTNNNDVIIAGEFSQGTFIDNLFLGSSGGQDSLVVRYDANGVVKWAKHWTCGANDSAYGIAVDAAGAVLVTGIFQGGIDFGCGSGVQSATISAATDVYMAKITSSAGCGWSKVFGGSGGDLANGCAADSSGNLLVTGSFGTGDINFGGGPISYQGSGQNCYLVKLSGSDGSHIWSKGFAHTLAAAQAGNSVAIDAAANVAITGNFKQSSDFGTGNLTSSGDWDVFAALFTSAGNSIWSKKFGGTGVDLAFGIARSGANILLTGGTFGGDYDGTPITTAGNFDVFVVQTTTSPTLPAPTNLRIRTKL